MVFLVYPLARQAVPTWDWSHNDGYDALAINWAETGTFGPQEGIPTATRLPLYPAVLALCRLLSGEDHFRLAMVIQAVLSVVTGIYLYRLTQILFGKRAAIATSILFVIHPQVNNFVFRCATETTFLFFVTALLYHSVLFYRNTRMRDAIFAGLYLGAAMMTRPSLALFPFVVLPPIMLRRLRDGRGREAAMSTLMMLAVALLIMGPWLTRNFIRSGHFPVLQTWIGRPLYQGRYVTVHLYRFFGREKTVAELDYIGLVKISRPVKRYLRELEKEDLSPIAREVLSDRYARRLALRSLVRAGPRFLLYYLRNLLLAPVLQMTWRSTIALMIWNWPLLLFSAAGVWHCYRRKRDTLFATWPVTGTFLCFLSVHALIWPQARYIMPALIPFSAFAGLFLAQLFDRFPSRRTPA